MKRFFPSMFLAALTSPVIAAEGLYYTGAEALESLPVDLSLGAYAIFDDHVAAGSSVDKDSSLAVAPTAGVQYTSVTPQVTLDIYGKLGLIHYFDKPDSLSDDTFSQSRINASGIYRYSERLRFVSRNYIANELEPEYAYGIASGRSGKESLSWMFDESVGYRWTERLGTYTGIRFSGNKQDVDGENDFDREVVEGYNQFRYQLTPQSVLTAEYRYSQTDADGRASDSTDQFLVLGVDHRFSPNTVGIFKGGVQSRDVERGDSRSNPYFEIALQSEAMQGLRLGAFTRYSMEVYDTVLNNLDYEDRRTLRIGANARYALAQNMSLSSGIDFIYTDYLEGRNINNANVYGEDNYEGLLNAYIGLSYKFAEYLYCNLYYSYTTSSSGLTEARDYDRNRISLGVTAQF